MANLTLTLARARVLRGLLGDPNGVTGSSIFNHDGLFTDVDQAFTFSLSACLAKAAKMLERFDSETTGTSTTSGTLDLSATPILMIKGVTVTEGTTTYRVQGQDPMRRGIPDATARALTIFYVRDYVLPTNAAHPLVGVGATAANSWPLFDEWVCQCASLHLLTTDNERREALELIEARTRAAVLERPAQPGGHPWPRPESNATASADIAWTFKPSTSFLHLTRRA